MTKLVHLWCFSLILCALFGCSDGAVDSGVLMPSGIAGAPAMSSNSAVNSAGSGVAAGRQAAPSPNDIGKPGLHRENGAWVFRTEQFTVDPGRERYLCWTVHTDEPLKVRSVDFPGAPAVHHLTFAQTLLPEPEGFSECEILLKTTWVPLFSAGAGANKLSLPEGVAHVLSSGTQLLVQLHLLNTGPTELTKQVALTMEVTDEPKTQPVQIGGFGSFKISLPPGQKTAITSECYLPQTGRVVAMMPHMHRKATSMILEMGTSSSDAKPIYKRDPWDFDQQTIDNLDMMFEAGKFVRVTCNYNNDTDKAIAYGESTGDEMCFLGVFWVGAPTNCVVF